MRKPLGRPFRAPPLGCSARRYPQHALASPARGRGRAIGAV